MSTFLGSAALAVRRALAPLENALQDAASMEQLLERYGWVASFSGTAFADVAAAFQLVPLFQALDDALTKLTAGQGDYLQLAQQARDAAVAVVHQLGSLGMPSNPPAFPLDQQGFWDQAPEDMLNDLLTSFLHDELPPVYGALVLLGVIETNKAEPQGAGRIPYTQTIIHWDSLGSILTNPGSHLASLYQWNKGDAPFDHARLLGAAEVALLSLGIPSRTAPVRAFFAQTYLETPPPADARELTIPLLNGSMLDGSDYFDVGLLILPASPQPGSPGATREGTPDGIVITTVVKGNAGTAIPLGQGVTLTLSGGFENDGGVALEAHPSGVSVTAGGATSIDAEVTLSAAPAQRYLILGSSGSHRIEIAGGLLSLAVRGPLNDLEIVVQAGTGTKDTTRKVTVVIQFSDGDGFLQHIFGTDPQRFEFGGLLAWSSNTGFSLQGSAGFTVDIPLNFSIGVAELDTLTVALLASGDGAQLMAALTGSATIGPVSVSIADVGVQFTMTPEPQHSAPSGLFGNLDVDFGFKPPDGIGLAVDSSLVTGGGYLFTDPASGLYAGAAELQLETIGLSAVGLLATKLPGGRAGFSLVVLVSVTFPPVELGFGFALTGVGGLLAVNSTVNVTALQSGLAAGSLDAVLFPADVASNAQRVVASLEQYFPAAPGQFVVGPAVQIIWGEDGIFTASIGVFVEFPSPLRVVLLGQLDVALPTAGEAIAEIELDVLGVVDFTARTLGLDAVLRNSHVAGFALTGAAALRASWGGQPGFLFAAGGFSPRFTPPASFPRLDPLALSLCTSDNPRLRVSAYLAVSSNTVQVGGLLDFSARVDLLLGTLGVTATLGIDTLFQLRPFAFFIDLHAMVAVTWNDNPVLSAQVDGTFTGPSPLYLAATATVHYLGTHHVHVELTIPGSDAPPPPPPPTVDAAAELRDALGQPSAWHSDPPPGGQHLARLAGTPSQGGTVAVHPLGVLTVRQRRLPLGQEIQQLGTGTLASPAAFTITAATVGQQLISSPPTVQDYFARGQFFALSDADKMSAPSFELMDAGVSVSSAATQVSGGQVTVNAAFTSILVPPADGQAVTQNGKVLPDSLLAACARSAPPRGPGSVAASYLGGPPQVTLSRPGYTVATAALTSPDPGQPPQRFATYSQAASQLAAGDVAGTQVVFADEVVTGPPAPAGPPLVPRPPVTGIITPVIPPARVQPFPPPLPPSPVQVA